MIALTTKEDEQNLITLNRLPALYANGSNCKWFQLQMLNAKKSKKEMVVNFFIAIMQDLQVDNQQ